MAQKRMPACHCDNWYQTETSVKEPASHSCCAKPNAACCKNNKDAKSCTAEQKASCEKASKSCSPTEAKKDDKK